MDEQQIAILVVTMAAFIIIAVCFIYYRFFSDRKKQTAIMLAIIAAIGIIALGVIVYSMIDTSGMIFKTTSTTPYRVSGTSMPVITPTEEPAPEPTPRPTDELFEGQTLVTDGPLYDKVSEISDCAKIVENDGEPKTFLIVISPSVGTPVEQATEFFSTVLRVTNQCKEELSALRCATVYFKFSPVTDKYVSYSIDAVYNGERYELETSMFSELEAMATDDEYNNAIVAALAQILRDGAY